MWNAAQSPGPSFQEPDEVHLYLLSLAALATACDRQTALGLLDEGEHTAFARIRAPGRQLEYLFGRWAVRTLLGRYLDLPPRTVSLVPDERGKPRVVAAAACPPALNISHSGDLLAIALAAHGEVGVDVERLDPAMEDQVEAIAARHFLASERTVVTTAPTAGARLAEFYRLWTLKEAILKSTGSGLLVPLNRVDVARRQDLYRARWQQEATWLEVEARHWPQPRPGYHLALARPGRLGRVIFHDQLPDPVRPATV